MRRFGRSLARGKRNPVCAAALFVFCFVLLWGCQEPRFEVGDPVGVPPLPPSDAIVGTFDKVEKGDLTEDVYQLKDLPPGSGQPVGIFFDGKYRLFFHYFDSGSGIPSVKMGTVQPASPYISTGDDGIASSSAVMGDIQGEIISVGDYLSRIGIPPGQGEPNRAGVNSGPDGTVQTQCIFDDNTRYNDDASQLIPVSLKDAVYSGVDGIMQSGLGGDDVQLIYAGETFSPAGTVVIVSPGTNGTLETTPGGGDDVQSYAPGAATPGQSTIVVEPGPDGVLQTCPLNDDYVVPGEQSIRAGANQRADSMVADDTIATVDLGDGPVSVIIDGGNGVAESGIGRNDTQRIPVGRGEPHTVAIIAARDPNTGAVRQLNTTPAGDDEIVNPGKGDLAGDSALHPDDKSTVVDPDGNGLVENYANVDDGEYFSWQDTNITFPAVGGIVPMPPAGGVVPPLGLNVPMNIWTYIPALRPVAPLPGFTPNYYTFDIIKSGSGLAAYVSNGMDIYRLTSSDGTTWSLDPAGAVLSAGGNGKASDPVVLAGFDGICDTSAGGDDTQNIAVGKGKSQSIAIFAGPDGVLQSQVMGDDKVDGKLIRTGKDGIRQSLVAGDDWEIIPLGQGQPDTACILAGDNGLRDTTDASLVNDDRPPFLDVDADSAAPATYLPEAGEPAVTENGSSGFDAFAVTHPSIFREGGKYYMLYTGWGALSEPEAHRPTEEAFDVFGPCQRPGMDRMIDNEDLGSTMNNDNTPGVVVAPRIGIAVSTDGINWTKKKTPIVGPGNTCADLFDLSLLAALGLDLEGLLGMKPFLVSNMDFDYSGAFGARMRSDLAADGEPVYSMIYGGLQFTRPYVSGLSGMEGLVAMLPASTGRENYAGLNKIGLGLARSFDITSGWTKLKDHSPIFAGGMFYEPAGETPPTVLERGDGYTGFFGQISGGLMNIAGDEEAFIGYSYRYGTVYTLCMTSEGAASPGEAAFGLLLLLLPAMILLARKVFVRVRSRG